MGVNIMASSKPSPSRRGGAARRAAAPKAARAAYHHGDLRRALIDAATQLVTEGGSAALTVRAAAQAAGVSIAAPYRHFSDRAALLAVGLAYVDFARQRPAVYRLMFSPECDKANHPALMAAGDRALGVLLGAVADVQAAGLIDAPQVQPLALAGWSLSHGLATLHADGMFAGKIPGALEDNARAVMELLLSSVLRAAPGRRSGAAPLHGTKKQDTPPMPIR